MDVASTRLVISMTDGKISKGENSASISLTLELLNIVKRRAGIDQQINGFWICKRWLMFDEEVKREIIEKHGQEFYDELLTHYSKTNIQQRKERELEEQAKDIKNQAKTDAKEQEKTRMIEFWTEKLEEAKKDPTMGQLLMNAERHLKELGVEV